MNRYLVIIACLFILVPFPAQAGWPSYQNLFGSKLGKVMDCIDPFAWNYCALSEKNKPTKARGGTTMRGGKVVYPRPHNNSPVIYPSYPPLKIRKPAKTWGNPYD